MKLTTFELIGVIFTIILGALLHFTYEWSENNSFVALFSAVNESTWEHLKLLFFPYSIFAIIEALYYRNQYPNLITGKCIGVLCGIILIPVLFYSYKLILGKDSFVFDISIFFISVVVSYLISYFIISKTALEINRLCLLLWFLMTSMFFLFTFLPPDCFLFEEPL